MTEVVADARPRGLPDAVFRAPVLRGLDDAARGRVSAAGRLRTIAPGAVAYREGERGDALAIVIRGSIALEATPRGSDAPRVLREAHAGESFGEEACLPGGVRQATARAISEVELVEIPVSVFRRGLGRDEADGEEGERRRDAGQAQLRLLRRAATADLLRTMVLTRDLDDDERGLVLDAVIHEHRARGERIYGVGERARELYMIASGLVQLQTEDADGRIQVRAYLSAGDFFGDEELTRGEPRKTHAFAVGDCQLLRLPGAALRTLADRNPKLLVGLRRIASQRGAHQQAIVGEASDRSTRHVFHDLYRMQMASSLLTIDQDTCVRCGHCAWSCAATHGGVARLVRRGDKVLTRLRVLDQGSEPRSLLLPNSCQHCKNPVCMIDCPTGAIGRDPEGEVFIREALCTGCGACAKACPWENIRMAPRPGDALGKLSSWLTAAQQARPSNDKPVAKDKPADYGELAVKCDLCRDYEAPACVQSCPTGSILRLDPERDFAEVAALLDPEKAAEARAREGGKAVGIALAWGLGGALLIGVIARFGAARLRGIWEPGRGPGLYAGIAAALLMLLLAAHVVPKRRVHLWMRRRARESAARQLARASDARAKPARSRVRPLVLLHMSLGALSIALVLGHAGAHLGGDLSGVLHAVFWLTALFGLWGALAYRVIPRRLSRLERSGALPEDLRGERERLVDRFHRELSGRSDLVKRAAKILLLPYALARGGWLALLLSGRDQRSERQLLQARVERLLGEQGSERLAGLEELVRTAVEIRAIPARRMLTALLRAFLPGHVVLTGLLLTLLAAHIVAQIGGIL